MQDMEGGSCANKGIAALCIEGTLSGIWNEHVYVYGD